MIDEIIRRVNSIRALVIDQEIFPIKSIENLANSVIDCLGSGNKIAFVGNGGSAAEAIHLAAEFTGKCVLEHPPLHAICLNESQSALTAIGNDFGFDQIFSRQAEACLSKGDILIALSTSGKSSNILKLLETTKKLQIETYLWSGLTSFNALATDHWKVPSKITPRIQEIHLMWGHILAEVVEKEWSNK